MRRYQKPVLFDPSLQTVVSQNAHLQGLTFIILIFAILIFCNQTRLFAKAPSPPNIISVSVRPGSDSVTVKWKKTSSNVDDFIIYEAINSFQVISSSAVNVNDPSLEEFTFFYPKVRNQPVSFNIVACNVTDNCGELSSNPHRTIYTTASWDSCKSTVQLNWTPYIGWGNQLKGYEVYSEVNGIVKQEAEVTDTSYRVPVQANQSFRFYVVAINNDATITSRSSEAEIFTKNSTFPKFILAKGSVFRGTELDLAFNIDAAAGLGKYQLLVSDNPNGNYRLLKEFNGYAGKSELNYTDVLQGTPKPSYYYLRAINNCNLAVDSSNLTTAVIPTVTIKDNTINLQWNRYLDWPHGAVVYNVYRLMGGIETRLDPQTEFNYFQDDVKLFAGQNYSGNICYHVEASSIYDGVHNPLYAKSATICVDLSESIFVPNAFTPNGDGQNDEFKAYFGFLPQDFTLQIFNRYGFKIFESKDPDKGWNGTIHGVKAPEGTYIYFIKFSSETGKVIEKKGNLSVIY